MGVRLASVRWEVPPDYDPASEHGFDVVVARV